MAINWDQLGNKLNQLLHNYAEFGKKYYDFFTAPPKDIPLEFYDENGNLINRNIPNVAKLRDRFISDVNSVMAKAIYVDAENGSDDTGDGSSSAPFKTLEKAVDSIPAGGAAYIFLLSDVVVTSKISVGNRSIHIDGYHDDGQHRKIKFAISPKNQYNTVMGFTDGGFIRILYCDIEFIDQSDPNLQFNAFAQVFDYGAYHTGTVLSWFVYIRNSKITLPDNEYIQLIKTCGAGVNFASIGLYQVEIVSEGNSSTFLYMSSSSASLNVYSATLSGAKNNWQDLIKGIVKDSNGVPRNIISNIIL